MFSRNLKKIMNEKGVTGVALARATGYSKAAVSQYINGVNIPSKERIETIAKILGVVVEELTAAEDGSEPEPSIQRYFHKNTLTCAEAAALLHKNVDFVRTGLQEGRPGFEFGTAVKVKKSGKWSYCIYANKFSEMTGISLNNT